MPQPRAQSAIIRRRVRALSCARSRPALTLPKDQKRLRLEQQTLYCVIIFFTIFALSFATPMQAEEFPTVTLQIRDQRLLVEVAKTAAQKIRGLGKRDSLAPNCGMLFPYAKADYYAFWMKGMRFDLDILWIRDHRIVDIRAHVPAPRGTPLIQYRPRVPADHVLEVEAGYAERHGWAIGDLVTIEPSSAY